MRHLAVRQPAQVIVFAGLALVAIVGAVAFVIDMGFFLEGRRELQNSADSAALAGVVYLPNCATDTGGSCGSNANANDAAQQVVNQNGPISRQLCGHPTRSAAPTTSITPGIYTPDPGQPGNFYYTLTVTLTCNPGFSFGRILLGSSTENIVASATAVIGGLGSVHCAAPLAAVQFPGTDDTTNFGYTPGLKVNSFPPTTGTGTDPVLLENDASKYIGPTPGLCGECGDFFEIYLCNNGCTGAPFVQSWFSGNPCVTLVLGQFNTISNSPGFTNSAVFQGLSERWCQISSTPNSCLSGNIATCPQPIDQVVDTSTWTVLPGESNSPCIMQVAILSYPSVSLCATGNCSQLNIVGFASMYVYNYSGNSPQHFEGVYVHADTLGDVTFFRNNGTYTIRLIR